MKYSINLKKDSNKSKIKKYQALIIVALILIIIFFFISLNKSNPTKTIKKKTFEQNNGIDKDINEQAKSFKISSIKIERNSPSTVFIKKNNEIIPYKINDFIYNKKIVRIHRDYIILRDSLTNEVRINKE